MVQRFIQRRHVKSWEAPTVIVAIDLMFELLRYNSPLRQRQRPDVLHALHVRNGVAGVSTPGLSTILRAFEESEGRIL